MPNHPLLFATESRYKIALLKRLRIPFTTEAPNLDESPVFQEHPRDLSQRLAKHKALHLRDRYPNHAILAADQAAGCQGQILAKPESFERAVAQLRLIAGQRVEFHTSVCLDAPTCALKQHTETVTVVVRPLSDDEIERYLKADEPLDCAGSFKVESLGIGLFDAVESRDPTALEGLPLIQVAQWFRDIGLKVP